MDNRRKAIQFVYRDISMDAMYMNCWLEVDEFVDEVYRQKSIGVRIDDRRLLEIIEPLYDKIMKNRKSYQGFKRQNAARGLKQLKSAVESSENLVLSSKDKEGLN